MPGRMGLRQTDQAPDPGLMLALLDSLHAGSLNKFQREATQALRAGILALAEQTVQPLR